MYFGAFRKAMSKVEMVEVKSSMIKSIGYDTSNSHLHVIFNSGSHGVYTDVSSEEYRKLREAESIGKHFHQHIRNTKDFLTAEDYVDVQRAMEAFAEGGPHQTLEEVRRELLGDR